MRDLIQEKLLVLQKQHNIRILHACESGSRAWGFPSPDSDYDVRFIYVHPKDWYITLRDRKDTIDLPIDDELDFGGWELSKALKLLWKSNAALLDWIQSPIVYLGDHTFLQELKTLAAQCFSQIAVMHHYQSMAKKYRDLCQGETVKLKHYLYALRTTLIGKWIREKGSIPPILFQNMAQLLNEEKKVKILEMILLKSGKNESYLHPREDMINALIDVEIAANEEAIPGLKPAQGDFEHLDQFFKKWAR